MTDYTWPSVFFSYLFFFLSLGVAVFFFIRSIKDGYWARENEEIKNQVFEGEGGADPLARAGPPGPALALETKIGPDARRPTRASAADQGVRPQA